jgi:hypothetical protein
MGRVAVMALRAVLPPVMVPVEYCEVQLRSRGLRIWKDAGMTARYG